MDIIYSPNDLLFKADTIEELKDKIVEYFTVHDEKPMKKPTPNIVRELRLG